MYYLDNPFILTKSQCKNNGLEMKDIKFQYSTNVNIDAIQFIHPRMLSMILNWDDFQEVKKYF